MSRPTLIKIASVAGVAALAAGLAACGSPASPSSSSATGSNVGAASGMPTVTLMVGGIDKQIYLPYQLAQDLGFYKKYGSTSSCPPNRTAVSAPRRRWSPGRST